MKTTLFIASEAREFRGLLRRLPSSAVDLPVDFARRVDRGEENWLLVANGPGTRLAAHAASTATDAARVDAIVSTGFCGALDPALGAGDVFMADRVISESGSHAARLPECTGAKPTGALACGDRVVSTAEEKRSLRSRTGAAAVDMESAAVAAHAHQSGIPFFCVRVVTDTASEDFANDFNAARDHAGRFDRGKIVANAFHRPFTRLPELLKLDRRCNTASELLGDFLAGCRF